MYEERRRYVRVPWFCPLKLTVLPEGPIKTGESFDISRGGVGVACNLMLERGTTVRIEFDIHDGIHPPIQEEVLGKVAYFRADEDGDRLGIEFLTPLNESTNPALFKKLVEL